MPDRNSIAKIPETYVAIRLHHRSERAWAVIASSTGAILTEGERLRMGLDRDEADRIAETATNAARARLLGAGGVGSLRAVET